MKLWLDDLRPAPSGWIAASSYEEAEAIIADHLDRITEVSLDHDLNSSHSDGDYSDARTGYDVLRLLLARGFQGSIELHSMSAAGIQRMQDLIDFGE